MNMEKILIHLESCHAYLEQTGMSILLLFTLILVGQTFLSDA
jgi:hypothetical protein